MTSRLVRALDALSQFGNVVIYNGDPNYSISGESYRKGWKFRHVIDFVPSPFERDHCRLAYENDVKKAIDLIAGMESNG